MPGARARGVAAVATIVAIGAVIALPAAVPAVREFFATDNLKLLLANAGWLAPLAFMAIMALAIVVSPLPNVPIAAVLGMAYGPLVGTAIAVAGALLGAMAAFGIARRFGERAITVLVGRPVRFCSGCSERTLSAVVLIARLLPIVSFDIVSYGAGMSTLRLRRFVVASLVGMIPWTWFYTTFGAAVLDNPRRATILGVVLAMSVLAIPEIIRRFNPFGLRRLLMDEPTTARDESDKR